MLRTQKGQIQIIEYASPSLLFLILLQLRLYTAIIFLQKMYLLSHLCMLLKDYSNNSGKKRRKTK